MPETFKKYIAQMKKANTAEELKEIVTSAIRDKTVNGRTDEFDKILEAMSDREKKLGIQKEPEVDSEEHD